MRRFFLTAMAAALIAVPAGAAAQSLMALFKQANNEFWNGEYENALGSYEKLESLGVNDPALFYNLGTTYGRLGRLGLAVLYYEKALKLDPGQDDARHNLEVIREFIARRASEAGRDADLVPAAGPWRAILDRFSGFGAAVMFVIFHLSLFLVLGIRRFVYQEMPRLSLGVVAGVLFILAIATGSVAIGKWYHDTYVREAVVLENGAIDVMEGPKSEVKRFAIEEGSRVEVLDRAQGWTRLLDGEGRDGWVPEKRLGII
jgi:tetratricopeptide (TPR) repeat protein